MSNLRCQPFHRRRGVTPESCLKDAHDRLADAWQHALRPRYGANPVHDVAGLMIHEHLEQLLAALRMVRQCAVGKSKSTGSANEAEHAGAVQRPEAKMANQHGPGDPGWTIGKRQLAGTIDEARDGGR